MRKTKQQPSGILTSEGMPTQAFLDSLTIGVSALDAEGRIVSMNQEGRRLLGWPLSSCTGRPLHDFLQCEFPWEEEVRPVCPIDVVLRKGHPIWIPKLFIKCRDSASMLVEYNCVPLGPGSRTGTLVTLRDLTLQHELERDHARLASISKESPFPIIEFDADANLLYANPAMTKLLERFGYDARGLPAILPDRTHKIIQSCLRSGAGEHNVEAGRGGSSYSWTFWPIPDVPEVRGYGIDITDIRQAQMELQSFAQRLEYTNVELEYALQRAGDAARAKSHFLATISHELRTPMNGVVGLTELLLDSPLTPEQRGHIELVKQSGDTMIGLINDVLDFSKMDAGKLDLECIDFDLQNLVDELLGLFGEQAQAKGLELIALIQPEVPVGLRGDPTRLRQVLTNLISNALKFTEQGEVFVEVTVAEDHVSPSPLTPHDLARSPSQGEVVIRFIVRDTGVGIPPEKAGKLFEPFSQADGSTTRKYGGTGLGLAICKQLAELMGGTIAVSSRPGEGSTFCFTIKVAAQPRTEVESARRVGLQGCRALVVVGNETLGRAIQTQLAAWGIECRTTGAAGEVPSLLGQAIHSKEPYHLVLVDMTVGGPGWQDLMNELQAPLTSAHTALMVLTPFGHITSEEEAGPDLVTTYCSKPIRAGELLRSLMTIRDKAVPARSPADAGHTAQRPQPHLPAPPTSSRQQEPSRRQRILIVEDNPVNQKVATRMVEKLGFQTDVLANGLDALTALNRGAYAAVLMDCQMPVMDGFAATREIRRREALGVRSKAHEEREASGVRRQVHEEREGAGVRGEGTQADPPDPPHVSRLTPHIPIIAMTANAMDGDRERCLNAGMDDYLAKPVKLADLRATIERWVKADSDTTP